MYVWKCSPYVLIWNDLVWSMFNIIKEVYDAFSFFSPNSRRKKNCNKNKSKTKLSPIAFAYSWCLECSWMSAFMWNASLKLLFNFLAYPISFPSSIGRFFVGPLLHARNMRRIVWAFFGLRESKRGNTAHQLQNPNMFGVRRT